MKKTLLYLTAAVTLFSVGSVASASLHTNNTDNVTATATSGSV